MKKLIPLFVGMALTFGAVTVYASKNPAPQSKKNTKKNTKKATKAS